MTSSSSSHGRFELGHEGLPNSFSPNVLYEPEFHRRTAPLHLLRSWIAILDTELPSLLEILPDPDLVPHPISLIRNPRSQSRGGRMGMRGEKPKLTKVFLYCPFFVVYLVTLTNVGLRSQRTRAFHLPPRAAAACPSAPWTPARVLH
jgi:hypothetical protein